MPLVRYFAVAGGLLLAILFFVGWYVPDPPPMARYGTPIDDAIIRIRSDHKWPKKVMFDTSIPTVVPPAASAPVVAMATTPDPPQSPAQQAFAEAPPPEPQAVEKHKQRIRKTRISRHEPPLRLAINPTPPMWPLGW